MKQIISKSQFKPHVLEYLRVVEQNKQPLIITHAGKPVVQIVPYVHDPTEELRQLRGTVVEYKDPLEAVDEKEWEAFK